MIRPATFDVDREGTAMKKAFLDETFGDLLPVVVENRIKDFELNEEAWAKEIRTTLEHVANKNIPLADIGT